MTKKNGGSAFPVASHDIRNGMTLRDWFAGNIAGSMWASLGRDIKLADGDLGTDAAMFYRMADAMIVARDKETN